MKKLLFLVPLALWALSYFFFDNFPILTDDPILLWWIFTGIFLYLGVFFSFGVAFAINFFEKDI